MGKEPEMIETDIEASRQNLGKDLDALADRVSPGRVVDRKIGSARNKASSVKDKVMGSAHSVSDSSGSAASSASGAAHDVAAKAEGNPLAAGLIAFGAGWLLSSLVPASDAEAQLADQAVGAAKEHGQPLVDHAKTVGQDVGQDLKESATEAASDLRSSAQDSAQNVQVEGQSAAQSVRADAQRD